VCAHFTTMVVTRTGRVLACGRGAYGSLGLGDTADRDELAPLALFESTRCVQLACGRAHTVFLAADGAVYGAGVGRAGQLGATVTGLEAAPRRLRDLPPAQALACGDAYTVVRPLAADAPAILLGLGPAEADPAWA
jgi:alpha-tubulin suppressor-like RCC1 family protein